jgi:hypothetical protein
MTAQQELLPVDHDCRPQVGRSPIRLPRRRIPAPAVCNGCLYHICSLRRDWQPLAGRMFDLLDRDIGVLTVMSDVPAEFLSFSHVLFV